MRPYFFPYDHVTGRTNCKYLCQTCYDTNKINQCKHSFSIVNIALLLDFVVTLDSIHEKVCIGTSVISGQ
uniref:Uncharacterized protein n=1 Tax=Arundo donax TaxID=35708 RepID=A0A0A9ED05_ARUDO